MLRLLTEKINDIPTQPALYWNNQTISYEEVGQKVARWMDYLAALLPTSEKTIGLMSQNSDEMYYVILALWSLEKDILFLNTHLSQDELLFQLHDAKVTFVVSEVKFHTTLSSISQIVLLDSRLLPSKSQQSDRLVEANNITSIMYTSGTTGKPKGVVQRFSNHQANVKSAQLNMGLTAKDCWACAVPLFHISGLSIVLRQLITGCSISLYPKFDAEQLTTDIVNERVTIASVVTYMLEKMITHVPTDAHYPPTFKTFLSGGGPVAKETLLTCRELELPVIQSYGMTETCSQVVALSANDALKKIGASGLPLHGMSLRIVDENNQRLPAKQTGEIQLKGPQVITHYLNETASHLAKWTSDGWFRTGDLGYLDEEGYLFVVSRLSELIISGGENIYPAEVEAVLKQHPALTEVAVVGESDDRWGQIPVAYVVANHSVKVEDLQQFASSKLAKYKQPKKVYLCDALPKTASGKLAKHRLLTKERDVFIRHDDTKSIINNS
ncbi:o-succinylbenzoate--CoA ligase [Vagococcus zengguangii]|uniref:2-succinylbenzoate--CoA ligase n=1 Tax=Vagococcus zengguangii TaxID=2571750 RepID=A0A4D7CU36_9ENTE|nr:o-succinylbenzoate--CoA ligase [Vagococcus zengguangii]QCI85897.1 o-succinylbenzoate--CoA ligase [Vagococcus zengguangii]TLG78387.1 o-succinylbenzoate--CoA ligase [Vagococcus zengguangii]